MRVNLFLVFVLGLAHAAISDKLPDKAKGWDDEDSMILPSTTSKGFSPFSKVPAEEKQKPEVVLEDGTQYISLVPASEQRDSSQEPKAEKETFGPQEFLPALDEQQQRQVKPEEPTATQEETAEDSGSAYSASSEYSTEGSKIRVLQLGKIPLTYEIIPLMSNNDHVNEKLQMKPVSFFPEQSGESMADKARILRREQQQQQQQRQEIAEEPHTEGDAPQAPSMGDELILSEPLTYLTPPKPDSVDYWSQYPLSAPTEHDSEATQESGDNPETAEVHEPSATLNPILERLNEFLQKAKRHSDELQLEETESEQVPQEELKEEPSTSTGETREISSTTQEDDETPNASQSSSTEGFTENSDEPPKSQNPLPTLATELVPPKPGFPETEPYPYPYQQPKFQPSSYWPNAIASPSPSMDQYFSDYTQGNLPINNKYYYPNPDLQIQTSMTPPRPLYRSIMDSYMPQIQQPRRYFALEKALSSENIDYPFIRYNDYYRPSRGNYIVRPTPTVMSSISNNEDSFLGRYGYSNELGYGNPSPNFGSNRYDSYYPRSYPMDSYRPIVPYRAQPTYSSSALVNNLMYAPMYPYQQYRQLEQQQEFI